jgi:hypothetical protein
MSCTSLPWRLPKRLNVFSEACRNRNYGCGRNSAARKDFAHRHSHAQFSTGPITGGGQHFRSRAHDEAKLRVCRILAATVLLAEVGSAPASERNAMKRFSVICLQCGLSVNRLIEVETAQTEIHPVTYRQK